MQAFLSKVILWLLMVMMVSMQTSAFAMHNCNMNHAASTEVAGQDIHADHAMHMANINETASKSDTTGMSEMDCCGSDLNETDHSSDCCGINCSCPTASCSSITAFNDHSSFSLVFNSDKVFGLTQVALRGIFSSLFKPPIQG